MTQTGPDVFVSYKAEDRARVAPLVKALAADGMSVWWDAHIGGGSNWRQQIEENLAAAHCVMVVWSEASVGPAGEFVRDEAMRARRRGIYLPVRIDAVEPPLGFGEVQAASLEGWKGSRKDPRYLSVLDSVRSMLRHEPHPANETVVPATPPAALAMPTASRRGVMIGGGALTALAAAGVGTWLLLRPSEAAAAQRIAVLPFRNLSGDPSQDYFAEGIAEELRGALARVGMQVIGRTSSEAVAELDAKAAAEKLGADSLLTGSVRKSPETIRISAQVVDGADGIEKWSQAYDSAPGDVLKIQSDIAQKVAQALQVTLGAAGKAAIELGGTTVAEAQEALLQMQEIGMRYSGKDSVVRSLAAANEALRLDPNFARAWVSKATLTSTLGTSYPDGLEDMLAKEDEADRALARALKIAPDYANAIAAGGSLDLTRLRFRKALAAADRALELAPNDVITISRVINILATLRPDDDALALIDRAAALDPLNKRIKNGKIGIYRAMKRFDEAIALAEPLTRERTSQDPVNGLAAIYLDKGDNAAAEALLPRMDQLWIDQSINRGILAGRKGDKAGVERELADLRKQFGVAASYQYGVIYAQAGEPDLAFAALDDAYQIKDPGLSSFKYDHMLEPLRKDPRYAALLKKLDFP